MACSNASGTHMLDLVFIYQYGNPRALKHINKDKLPVNLQLSPDEIIEFSLGNQGFQEKSLEDSIPMPGILSVSEARKRYSKYSRRNICLELEHSTLYESKSSFQILLFFCSSRQSSVVVYLVYIHPYC